MTVAAPPEAPEGERLAKLEAAVEYLIREVGDVKADGRDTRAEMREMRAESRAEMRDIRTTMNRNLLITIGIVVTTWITIILALLFGM